MRSGVHRSCQQQKIQDVPVWYVSGIHITCPPRKLTTSKALFGATTCLFVRTIFRSVELSEGFAGKLANQEVEFMMLDGVMVVLASVFLTICHPGYGFGKRWNEAGFRFRTSKAKVDQEEAPQTIARGGSEKVEPETSAERL